MNYQDLPLRLANEESQAVSVLTRVALVVLLLLSAYWSLFSLSFSMPDDDWMLLENELVQVRNGIWPFLKAAFISYDGVQYSPLNTLYYAAIYKMNGYDPHVYHAFSFLLHLVNIKLVYLLSRELLKSFHTVHGSLIAYLTCVFWAVHPLNVEAVVWISASKVLLFSLFSLASFLLFAIGCRKGGYWHFTSSIVLFAAACLCKEQALVHPVILCVYAICRRLSVSSTKRMDTRVIVSLVCMVVISALTGIILMSSKSVEGMGVSPLTQYSFGQRLVLAAYSMNFYLTRLFIPLGLHYHYPYPFFPKDQVRWNCFIYFVIPVAATLIVVIAVLRRRFLSFYAICLAISVFHLVLVIQIIPMNRPAVMADRYMYLPSVGLILIVIAFAADRASRTKYELVRYLLPIMVGVYILAAVVYDNFLVLNWANLNLIN